MRQHEIAERVCRGSLDIDPNFYFAQQYLRDMYVAVGNERQAAEHEIRALGLTSGSELTANLRQTLDRGGFREYWQHQLAQKLNGWNGTSDLPSRRAANRYS